MTGNDFDSVFANSADELNEFDVIFDEDDSIIDTVNGVNEAGDPLTGVDFPELHQTDDDATPKDIEKELGNNNNTFGAKNIEGTEGFEPDDNSKLDTKPSDADKFERDAECKYQCDNKNGPEPEDDVTDTIDAALGESFYNESEYEADKYESGAEDEYQHLMDKEPKEGEDVTDLITSALGEKCCTEDDDPAECSADDDEDDLIDNALGEAAEEDDDDEAIEEVEDDSEKPSIDLSYGDEDDELINIAMGK